MRSPCGSGWRLLRTWGHRRLSEGRRHTRGQPGSWKDMCVFTCTGARELCFEDAARGMCENSGLWWEVACPDWKQLWAFDFLEE